MRGETNSIASFQRCNNEPRTRVVFLLLKPSSNKVLDWIYTSPEGQVMRERDAWTLFKECPV